MEFNYLGGSIESYEPDQNNYLAQLAAQHLPGCRDPYQLLDQCAFCSNHDQHGIADQQTAQASAVLYPTQEQHSHGLGPRTYAQAVSTMPVVHASLYGNMAMSDFNVLQTAVSDLRTSTNTYNTSQPHTTPWETYAQVVQRGIQSPTNYGQDRRSHDQYLHPYYLSQRAGTRSAQPTSNAEPLQARRSRQNVSDGSWPDQRTNRSTQQATYQQGSAPNPTQVQAALPVQYIPPAQPRNVSDFIQAATIGGHRHPPPSSLNNHGDVASPLSTGTLSVASSSASRPSNRRTGQQMRDPSLPHVCIICHSTFARLEDLSRHVHRVHAEVADRPHRCEYAPLCPWAFVNPKDLRRHMATHDPQATRQFCPYEGCEKSYTRADNLTRHINRSHVQDSAYMSFDMSRTTSEVSHQQSDAGPEWET